MFKNTALANFHAEKSGHDQFEESAEEVRACAAGDLFRSQRNAYLEVVDLLIRVCCIDQAAHGGGKERETCGVKDSYGGETSEEGC